MTGFTEAMWDDLLNQRDKADQGPTDARSKATQIKANRNKFDERYQRRLTNQHLMASHLRNAICAILPLSQQSASAVAFNAQSALAAPFKQPNIWRPSQASHVKSSSNQTSRSPEVLDVPLSISIRKCFTLHIRDFSTAVTAFSTRSAAPDLSEINQDQGGVSITLKILKFYTMRQHH